MKLSFLITGTAVFATTVLFLCNCRKLLSSPDVLFIPGFKGCTTGELLHPEVQL
jgi:hypothetical protein